ncbi:hypothetical protein NMG60_11021412 [Bertholletia excelsa]
MNKIKVTRLNRETLLIIKLPNSLVLQVLSRSLCLAMMMLALPYIGSVMREPSGSSSDPEAAGSDPTRFGLLPLIFHDLAGEGLLKKGDKVLLVSSHVGDFPAFSKFLTDNEIDLAFESDPDGSSYFPDETFDLVIALELESRADEFADRLLKTGGLFVMTQSDDPSNAFHQKHPNFKIVYLRRFTSTVLGMRKTCLNDESQTFPGKKPQQCGCPEGFRKAALKGLEDVLLEPPTRRASDYMKRTKFLPDLLGDSLESYRRRIFITDNGGGMQWFQRNYPTRNQNFEVYKLEIEELGQLSIGVSEWLRTNVREEDFVVMKAEAALVEEMMREKSICLVDEMFLACNNEWEGSEGKRAYWECLALYGRVRDKGVAVHQWWG